MNEPMHPDDIKGLRLALTPGAFVSDEQMRLLMPVALEWVVRAMPLLDGFDSLLVDTKLAAPDIRKEIASLLEVNP